MSHTFKILVIDDEPGVRESLAEYLQDMGFSVLMAESGEKGLEILTAQPVDLAIVDMRLPGIDGTQTIVKALDIQSDLKVIVHTGSVSYQIPEELLSLGFTSRHILHKPMPGLTTMLETIHDLLGIALH